MSEAPEALKFPIFALTGGVGSGKSTVAEALRARGYPIVDADALARALTSPGSEAVRALALAFGPQVVSRDEVLDRRALAALVFGDRAALERLNRIMHPRIAAAATEEFRRHHANGREVVGYEVPLLFETRQESKYHPVVVVHVPRAVQLERAMKRSGWTREETEARIAAQLDLDEKAARSDFVVDNAGSAERLASEVERLVRFLEGSRPREAC